VRSNTQKQAARPSCLDNVFSRVEIHASRTLHLILAIGSMAAFASINWVALTTPTALSLALATSEAPLGLIMQRLAVVRRGH